jgi:hypothetical protein
MIDAFSFENLSGLVCHFNPIATNSAHYIILALKLQFYLYIATPEKPLNLCISSSPMWPENKVGLF